MYLGFVTTKKEALGRVEKSLRTALNSRLPVSEILNVLRKVYEHQYQEDVLLPISIFNSSLGALEAITVYLREHKKYKHKDTGRLLNRNAVVVGHSYRSARKKTDDPLDVSDQRYLIPVSIFTNRKISIQTHLVRFLHDTYKIKLADIARLLSRDPRTIWSAYHRGETQ